MQAGSGRYLSGMGVELNYAVQKGQSVDEHIVDPIV